MVPIIQVFVVAFLLAGERIAEVLGVTTLIPPELFHFCKQNRGPLFMGTWLVGNILQSALVNTGAFEVMLNENLIHSKLATGAMPDMEQLYSSIEEILNVQK